MAEKFIPQMEPSFGEEEITAMDSYLRSGGWLTEFKKTEEFEQAICKYTGAKYCVATNNGTISLTLALLALGIKKGDEVIVPNLTMIATPNSAKLFGANPILVDVEKETLCIDLEKAKEAITSKTKALIHVSFNGRTNDLEAVKDFCEDNDLAFLEDAAQSLGSFHKKKHLGRYGDIGSFSFSAPKIITTGQGGALITEDEKLYSSLRKLKDFGRTEGGNDFHNTIGYNFKFTDMQAVIGIEQIKKLPDRVERKRQMYSLYQQELEDIKEIEFVPTDLSSTTPWFIDIYSKKRAELQVHLKSKDVGSREIYPPINSQKAYNVGGNFPITEDYSSRGLWLPSSVNLTNEQIKSITAAIKEYYNAK